ncbi:MAG: LLM class flavin-dependent oxidoreductase [Nitrososphaerota archaeon]|nr:LLM class flavin-dependent oxidoreductase [Nitrososphaerota archaeon]
MKFGVFASNWEPFSYNPHIYEKIAMLGEEIGYEFFLTSNHYVRPGIGTAQATSVRNQTTIDSWSLLSYLAGKTSKIRIGALVTPVTLHNPFMLAKIVSSVDALSDGRVIFGAGAGFEKREFELYGKWDETPVRVKKTEEALILLKKLWTEEVVNFKGKYYEAKGVVNEPKPPQRESLPIWTGAMGEKTLGITARLGDAWVPSLPLGATLDFYEVKSKKLKAMTASLRRKVTMGILGHVVSDDFTPSFEGLGTLKTCHKKLEAYRSMGCELAAINFLPPTKTLDLMKSFYNEIVPSFS